MGWEIVTVVLGRFDLPGHTYGMRSLDGELTFCKGSDWTIDGDAASIAVLKTLVAEMAALFDDDVFHLGMDEVSEPPPCTADGTRTLEAALLAHVEALGKTPMGWDLCGNQPLVWGVPTKLQNSLSRSNRSRFG